MELLEDEWNAFRKDAAVKVLSALVSNKAIRVDQEDNDPEELGRLERSSRRCAYTALKYVDALIYELKLRESL